MHKLTTALHCAQMSKDQIDFKLLSVNTTGSVPLPKPQKERGEGGRGREEGRRKGKKEGGKEREKSSVHGSPMAPPMAPPLHFHK